MKLNINSNIMKKIIAGLVMSMLFVGTITAQEKSNEDFKKWQMRFRIVNVMPNESATIGTIGGDIAINNKFIPELDFTYFFTENFSLELILGTSKHNVNTVGSDLTAVAGPASTNVDLGSVWLLPPTLTAQYHFNYDNFRPYVGAGINYTIFYSVNAGNTIKDVSYDNAFGFAFQGGLDYDLNDKWFLNIDAKYILLNTDVTVDASNLAAGLSIPAKVDINPLLIGFGVGMRF
jgi:outer membrane protein